MCESAFVMCSMKHPPDQGVLQKTAISAAICWAEPDETVSEAAGLQPTPQLSGAKDWQEKERRYYILMGKKA